MSQEKSIPTIKPKITLSDWLLWIFVIISVVNVVLWITNSQYKVHKLETQVEDLQDQVNNLNSYVSQLETELKQRDAIRPEFNLKPYQ